MNYEDWADSHCQTFGLLDSKEVAMVLSWQSPLCDAAGYTIPELANATTWMAASSAPGFRTDHLRMIEERVSGQRLLRSAREKQKELDRQKDDDRGTCVKCFGAGFMIVPHPESIHNGVWIHPWYTNAVYCACGLGRHVASGRVVLYEAMCAEAEKSRRAKPKSIIAMTISEYERLNPFWEGQIEERQRAENELAAARAKAREADRQRGPLAKDIERLVQLAEGANL